MYNILISFFFILLTPYCFSANPLDSHQQMMTVVVADWESVQGVLQRYERHNLENVWFKVGKAIPVVIGINGMAWGLGIHEQVDIPHIDSALFKREGDGKSPAGIFTLGTLFGFKPIQEWPNLKMNYLELRDDTEFVDDPHSIFYNQIVNRSEIENPDWNSSEKMREIELYEIGLVINHNFPLIAKGDGSAICMHIWRDIYQGTGGCTAMKKEYLEEIFNWLDRSKNPIIVQLPIKEYKKLQAKWSLPIVVQEHR